MSEIDMRDRAPGDPPRAAGAGAGEPSLAELVGSLVTDAQILVRKEIELARAELSGEIDKAKRAGIAVGAGAAIAAVGALLLVIMVVQVLIAWGLAPWLAYLIVGGALTAVGALALVAGLRRAQSIDPMPRETIQTVQEDVEWLKEQNPFEKR
jgi:uncharacterized membrane protein YqjE